MSSQNIRDLKASVLDLGDTIVQDVQEPNYSKVALVPYAQALNAGSYTEALRRPIRGLKAINSITLSTEPAIRNTSAVNTRRNGPITITSNGHNYADGDWIFIWGVSGTTQLNGRAYQVTARSNNSFQLRDQRGNDYSAYRRDGKMRKCSAAGCQLQVTSNGHGY